MIGMNLLHETAMSLANLVGPRAFLQSQYLVGLLPGHEPGATARPLPGTLRAGTALGGGGNMSTRHAKNFFEAIRGKEALTSPIDVGATSQIMTHYANISYRIDAGFDVDPQSRKILDERAMKYWSRDYEAGWRPGV